MMKSLTFNEALNHRKWQFHFTVALLSVIIPVIFFILKKEVRFMEYLRLIVILFIQLEIFLMIARIIFMELRPGMMGKELTKTVMSRFLLFNIFCFISALVIFLLIYSLFDLAVGADPVNSIRNFFNYDFGGWTKSTLGGLIFGAGIFIFIQWQDALKREQKLREENLIFQNQTLKNQVNPHFLFNSLNTLSALIPEHPAAAERFIVKLSSIYRYILENSPKDSVSLESELEFINDYYYLHSIRDDGKIILSVNVPDAEKFRILPVSLQILVENAIKHNTATRQNPLLIRITAEENYIVVRNNLQRMPVRLKSTAIGLNNLRERVRLVTGREVTVGETANEFVVRVPLIS